MQVGFNPENGWPSQLAAGTERVHASGESIGMFLVITRLRNRLHHDHVAQIAVLKLIGARDRTITGMCSRRWSRPGQLAVGKVAAVRRRRPHFRSCCCCRRSRSPARWSAVRWPALAIRAVDPGAAIG